MMYCLFVDYCMKNSTNIEKKNISQKSEMLPVILTCPHDGKFGPSDIPKRKKSNSPRQCRKNFRTKGDSQTRELTTELRIIFTNFAKNMYT